MYEVVRVAPSQRVFAAYPSVGGIHEAPGQIFVSAGGYAEPAVLYPSCGFVADIVEVESGGIELVLIPLGDT